MRLSLVLVLTVAFTVLIHGVVAVAASGLQPSHEQRLYSLFKQSERFEREGDVVKAYALLHEAARLEQLWTNNMVGPDALSSKRLNRFILAMIRRDDASVQRILHSKQIALGDKLSMIHVLEQDILVNFPGHQESDGAVPIVD